MFIINQLLSKTTNSKLLPFINMCPNTREKILYFCRFVKGTENNLTSRNPCKHSDNIYIIAPPLTHRIKHTCSELTMLTTVPPL